TNGEFGWAVRLPTVSVKTAVAVRLDTVVILALVSTRYKVGIRSYSRDFPGLKRIVTVPSIKKPGELGINWRVNQTKDCMANWVRQLFFGRGNQKKLIVIIAIWAIWLSRNKLVHEGKQQSKTEIVTFILGYVHELELLTGKRVEQAAEETVVWRSPSNPFVRRHWLVPRLLDSQELGFWAMVVERNSLVWVEDGLTVIQRLVEEKGQSTLQ
ncbi:hypothetical protein Golob_025757, partial [Gossypium lobatum]|nr:hypothetical protein [Gossypium lobatum]